MNSRLQNFFRTLGPGILFASTAIGVSHLVQSTRAGAAYGFALLWAVIAANLFKYPFFEYGSRYASATGESLIDGYQRLGKWMLWLYFLITLCSMFFVSAAVGAVTAGFFDNLLGISTWIPGFKLLPITIVFVVCIGILAFGKYGGLDTLIKLIGGVLLISTLVAFALTLFHGPVEHSEGFVAPNVWDGGIPFLIALMGWMPTAVDLSTWNSLWTIERIKQTGYRPTLKQTLFEFNLGYWISAGLSICFVTLGAYLIYGTGQAMPNGGAAFASWVIELYTTTIGNWSNLIIAASAFSIMFGTAIGVFDGFSRALERTTELLFLNKKEATEALGNSKFYVASLLVIGVGAYSIIAYFSNDPKGFSKLVDLATTLSFLIAPVIAVVNLIVVCRPNVPIEAQPSLGMKILSWAGIVFLTGFAVFYLYTLNSP